MSEAPRLSLLFPARARVLSHQVTSNPVSTGLRDEWSARQPWQLSPVEDGDSPEVLFGNSWSALCGSLSVVHRTSGLTLVTVSRCCFGDKFAQSLFPFLPDLGGHC